MASIEELAKAMAEGEKVYDLRVKVWRLVECMYPDGECQLGGVSLPEIGSIIGHHNDLLTRAQYEAEQARKDAEEANPKPGEVWETSTGAVLIYLAIQGPPPLTHHIFVLESGDPELVEVREDRSGWTKLADSPEAYYRAKIEAEHVEQAELFTRQEVERACQFACAEIDKFHLYPEKSHMRIGDWVYTTIEAIDAMIAERDAKGKADG